MGTAYARMRCIKILLFIFNLSFWVSVGPGAEGGKGGTAAPAGRGLGVGLRRARPDTARHRPGLQRAAGRPVALP